MGKAGGNSIFAGYPLIVEDRVVGVMAMSAHKQLPEFTLQALKLVADKIALGIDRKQAEDEISKLAKFPSENPITGLINI